jgi:hypothetical protein
MSDFTATPNSPLPDFPLQPVVCPQRLTQSVFPLLIPAPPPPPFYLPRAHLYGTPWSTHQVPRQIVTTAVSDTGASCICLLCHIALTLMFVLRA